MSEISIRADDMPRTPTLDSVAQLREHNEGAIEGIGSFIEWLAERGYRIARYPENPLYCGREGAEPDGSGYCVACGSHSCGGRRQLGDLSPESYRDPEQWLFLMYGIDPAKVAEERDEVYRWVRARAEAEEREKGA